MGEEKDRIQPKSSNSNMDVSKLGKLNNIEKQATKDVVKGAANAYLGPVGGKAVDALSKTKLGDAVLTKGAEALKNPKGMMNPARLATSRANLVNKNMQTKKNNNDSGEVPDTSGSAPTSNTNYNDVDSNKKSGRTDFLKNLGKSQNNTDVNGDATREIDVTTKMLDFAKKHWLKILSVILYWGFIIGIILIIIFAILSPAETVIQFFRDGWDQMRILVTGDKSVKDWEFMYYQKLDEVQENLNEKYGVCVDINLITATLTVDVANDEYIEEGKENVDAGAEGGSELGLTGADYKKMIQQIELLSNMQIRRQVYGLDKAFKKETGSYCADVSKTYPFDAEQNGLRSLDFDYETPGVPNFFSHWYNNVSGLPVRDSTTIRKIASNDLDVSFLKFFTRKANEEKNIEYLFYIPAFTKEEVKDANGKVIGTKKVCYNNVPKDVNDFAKLDIGSLNDMENNVYYWNLIDHFIGDYYADYLPKVSGQVTEGSEVYNRIKNIIEDIYLLYNEMGPNQSCKAASYICRDDEGSDYYGGGETSLERSEFIDRIAPVAIEEMSRTGISASITIAQAVLESNNGSSGLSSKYSNYYGMTAGNCAPKVDPSGYKGRVFAPGIGDNNCTGNAFWDGTVVALCNSSGADCQWYRVYDSFKNSTMDHSRLLTNSNYQLNNFSSLEEQLQALIDGGYATDSSYKNKLKNLISDYNLTQFNIGNFNGTIAAITEPQYTNQICIGGSVIGDWANWKQYDPAWSSVPLGPHTVGKIGCAMTSVAIQIARAGLSTTLGSNFNPGTFAQELTKIGGFDSAGNINWGKVTSIAPNFRQVSRGYSTNISQINQFVNEGYYVILQVKNGRHWVAVDRVEGNKIYMFDPGSGGTEVGQTYGLNSIVGYTLYKKG